jgi:hypothetical protein
MLCADVRPCMVSAIPFRLNEYNTHCEQYCTAKSSFDMQVLHRTNFTSGPISSGLLVQFSQRIIGSSSVRDNFLLQDRANDPPVFIKAMMGSIPGLPCFISSTTDKMTATWKRAVTNKYQKCLQCASISMCSQMKLFLWRVRIVKVSSNNSLDQD